MSTLPPVARQRWRVDVPLWVLGEQSDDSGRVEHGGHTGKRVVVRARLGHIAGKDLQPLRAGQPRQEAILGRIVTIPHTRPHGVAAAEQQRDQVRPEVAAGAGDSDDAAGRWRDGRHDDRCTREYTVRAAQQCGVWTASVRCNPAMILASQCLMAGDERGGAGRPRRGGSDLDEC